MNERRLDRNAKQLIVALALFLLALGPRAFGLDIFITPDEHLWIERSGQFLAALLRADWAATFQVGHPGLTTRWTGALGILATYLPRLQMASGQLLIDDHPSAWLVLSGIEGLRTSPFQDLLADMYAHLPEVLAATRYPTAILTSIGVVGLYFLVRPLFGQRAALLSAVLLALDPFYLALSRVIHHDALSTTFMALSLLSFMVYLKGHRLSPYLVLSGLTAGLAFLSKSPSLFLVPFTVLLSLRAYWAWKGNLWPLDWRRVAELGRDWAFWGLVAALVFVLLWPAMWVDPLGTIQGVMDKASGYAASPHERGNFFMGKVGMDPGPLFYPIALLFRLTPLTLLGLGGSLLLLGLSSKARRNQRRSSSPHSHGEEDGAEDRWRIAQIYFLWVFIPLYVLFMTMGAKKFDRYLLPIFPVIDILAALGLLALGEVIWAWACPEPFDLAQDKLCRRARGRFERVPRFRTSALGLGLVLLLQAGFVLPHYPYYLTYYNPLLGGIRQAARTILVGWGEGYEQAVRYLNQKDDAAHLRVATWYAKQCVGPFFEGQAHKLNVSGQEPIGVVPWYNTDYVIFYINQVQRDIANPATVSFFRSLEPEYTVRLKGLEYAWVYKVPEAVPEDAYPFGQVALVDLDDKVRLLGYDVGEVTVEADGKAYLPLTLYWQNLGPFDVNYRLYLKLINGVYHIWGQQEGYPLWDGFMTSTWQKGVVIRDDRQIEILPGTPPGAYQVTVNWLDPYSGLSLHPTGNRNLLLGPFDIPPRPPPTIESLGIEHPMKAELDGQVRFLGYNLEGDFRPGGGLHLTLFWQALAEMDENYTVFTHLIDEREGIRGQKDNPPVDGFYPTGGWTVGEIVRDQYDLAISPEAPFGLYRIAVGMYRAETGERLVVRRDAISPYNDKIVLGEFVVRNGE